MCNFPPDRSIIGAGLLAPTRRALAQAFHPEATLARGSPEFVVAIAAFGGVLTSGLLRGVLIGAAISLVQLMGAASRPHVALLGRIPGTRRFSDRERHQDNELIPNVMIFRPESGLVYFNVDNVVEAVPLAYQLSESGDVILLSPACASWDQFKTFEVRGDIFIEAVHKLK